jgi:hypothetical protein
VPFAETDPTRDMTAPRVSSGIAFAPPAAKTGFRPVASGRIATGFDVVKNLPPPTDLPRGAGEPLLRRGTATALAAEPPPATRNPLAAPTPAGIVPPPVAEAATGGAVPLPRDRPDFLSEVVPIPRARPRIAGLPAPTAAAPPAGENAQPKPAPVDGWPRLVPRAVTAALGLPGREMTSGTCRNVFALGFAVARVLEPIDGPGACDAPDLIALDAVTTRDGRRIEFSPPARLNCAMGEAIARWVRDDLDPAVRSSAGGRLARVHNAADYQCRPMNWMRGNRMSAHSQANALDIRALTLEDGRTMTIREGLPDALAASWRQTTCNRFSTVLGPGSDGFHEDHIHVDLMERRSANGICRWRL